ncbi:hypothetical protein KCU78_g11996, partial [Aureobasidium melanogenum]
MASRALWLIKSNKNQWSRWTTPHTPQQLTPFSIRIGFRWGFGIWAIIYPVVCAPLSWLMWHNMKKVERQGLISKYSSGRTWKESIYYYAVQFDIIGILLIATGLSLFLLSFSLYSYQAEQWKSPLSSLGRNSFRLY